MAHLTFSRVKPIIVGKGESLDGIGWSGSKRPKYKVLPDGGTEPGAELVPSIIQPKFDGWRLLVHIRDGNVRFLNKQGQAFGRSLPFLDTLREQFEYLSQIGIDEDSDSPQYDSLRRKLGSFNTVLDCELIGTRDDGDLKLMIHTVESDFAESRFITDKGLVLGLCGKSKIDFVHSYPCDYFDIPEWAHHYQQLMPHHSIEGVVRKTPGWAYIKDLTDGSTALSEQRRSRWIKHKPSEKYGRGMKCSEIFKRWFEENADRYKMD